MTPWSEDLTGCSLEDVLSSQSNNRAWSKELRLQTAALINKRLAKDISRDEYMASRKLTDEHTAECRRRAAILLNRLALLSVHR
jgi:hypothetical protein